MLFTGNSFKLNTQLSSACLTLLSYRIVFIPFIKNDTSIGNVT